MPSIQIEQSDGLTPSLPVIDDFQKIRASLQSLNPEMMAAVLVYALDIEAAEILPSKHTRFEMVVKLLKQLKQSVECDVEALDQGFRLSAIQSNLQNFVWSDTTQ